MFVFPNCFGRDSFSWHACLVLKKLISFRTISLAPNLNEKDILLFLIPYVLINKNLVTIEPRVQLYKNWLLLPI